MIDADWETTAFVLIGPDAVARHLAEPVLRRIRDAGFAPVGYRPLPLPPPALDEMYERNIRTVWDAYRFRLVDLLFAYGPMLLVLFEDTERDPARSGHERLRMLKGDSDPARAEPGTIRHDLWAINVTMSLMHASDSAEDAAYESGLFFGDVDPTPAGSWADIARACTLISPATPESRRFDEVLGGLRARIALAVWDDLSPAGRDAALDGASRGLAALARPGAGQTLASYLTRREAHPLAAALAHDFTPEGPRVDWGRMSHLLAAFGVQTDRWEELVLKTSMMWAPRRVADG